MENEKFYIEKLAAGSEEAFEWIFIHYQPKIIYFITGFIKNEEIAQDMAQDIFITIWNKRTSLLEIDSFSTYVYKMAKNALYNYFDHYFVENKYRCYIENKEESYEDEEEIIIADELRDIIRTAVEKMPDRRKEIFKMSRYQGLSNDEIAIRLNINKRTVENHLTNALSELRRILAMLFL